MSGTEVTVVVQAHNERAWLERLLGQLQSQTVPHEVVVVVCESWDGTTEVAEQHGARVVQVSKSDFSYPRMLNAGMELVRTPYAALTVAHVCLVSDMWLASGLRHFRRPEDYRDQGVEGLAGVWAHYIWTSTSWTERLVTEPISRIQLKRRGVQLETRPHLGLLAATNAMIPTGLWRQYNFPEHYGAGGEDAAWARYWLYRGFGAMHEPEFTVEHGHNLGPIGVFRQLREWSRMGEPRPFDPTELLTPYRK